MTYDTLDRLTQALRGATTETYAYDQEGKRIRKVSAGVTTNFHYMGPDIYAEYGTAFTAQNAIYTHGPNWDDPIIRQTGTGPAATANPPTKVTPSVNQPISVKTLLQEVRDSFANSLTPFGFEQRNLVFLRAGWQQNNHKVTIGYRAYGADTQFMKVDVHVGLVSEPIERVLARLDAEAYRPSKHAITFGTNLGYLMPSKSFYDETLDTSVAAQAIARLTNATIRYGLPFLEQHTQWSAIFQGIEKMGGVSPDIQLPIVRYLEEQPDRCHAMLEQQLKLISNQSGAAAELFRRRAIALRGLLH